MGYVFAIIIIVAIVIFIVNKVKDDKKYKNIREQFNGQNSIASIQSTKCKFCGADLKPGIPFCEQCGHSVNEQKQQ